MFSSLSSSTSLRSEGAKLSEGDTKVLTVWKKSLMFNCSGFMMFGEKVNLVFKVENYAAGDKGEIILMDASG